MGRSVLTADRPVWRIVSSRANATLLRLTARPSMANGNMAYPHASSSDTTDDTDKQPWFPGPSDVDHGRIQEMADADLETLREVTPKIVVVVHDAEKKFSSAALDIAINSHATAEGDTILVLAFMEKFVCDCESLPLFCLSVL